MKTFLVTVLNGQHLILVLVTPARENIKRLDYVSSLTHSPHGQGSTSPVFAFNASSFVISVSFNNIPRCPPLPFQHFKGIIPSATPVSRLLFPPTTSCFVVLSYVITDAAHLYFHHFSSPHPVTKWSSQVKHQFASTFSYQVYHILYSQCGFL